MSAMKNIVTTSREEDRFRCHPVAIIQSHTLSGQSQGKTVQCGWSMRRRQQRPSKCFVTVSPTPTLLFDGVGVITRPCRRFDGVIIVRAIASLSDVTHLPVGERWQVKVDQIHG